MSIAFIRESTGSIDTSVTTSVTLAAAAAAGNVLVAAVAMSSGTVPTLSAVTTSGVTWSMLGRATRGRMEVELWLGIVTSGSGTTVTFSGAGTAAGDYLVCNISEWSGVDQSSPVDVTAASNNGNSTSPTVSYTTATANDTVIAMAGWQNGTAASATPASFGYTMLSPVSVAFNVTVSVGTKATPVAGGQFANWTISLANWGTLIVGLKQSSTVPSTAYGIGLSASKASATVSRVGKAFGVTVSTAKCSGTIIKYGAAHGITVARSKGTLEKYFGSLHGLAVSTSKCSATVIRSSSAHGIAVTRSTARFIAQTLIGKAHGIAISRATAPLRKRTLPPSSSAGLRVGTWTTNRPSG